MRYILLIAALCLFSVSSFAATPSFIGLSGVVVAPAGTCSSTPVYTESSESANVQVTSGASTGYTGGYWTGAPFSLCKASVRMRKWLGDTSSKVYAVSVYSPNGAAIGTLKGRSNTLTGYNSTTISHVEFSFATPVAVSTGDIIVFSETSPVADAANYVRVYHNNASDSDFDQSTWNISLARTNTYDGLSPSFILYPYN